MRQFLAKLYETVLKWSRHKKAPFYLFWVSFLDASVFPISPMFMLIPMAFSKPEESFRFAFLATIGSVLGGLVGYGLGMFANDIFVQPFLNFMGYAPQFQTFIESFQTWSFWAVLIGAFVPIPYKFFTIGGGILQMHLGWFILASALGRLLRFYIVSAIIYWGGPKMEPYLRKALIYNK